MKSGVKYRSLQWFLPALLATVGLVIVIGHGIFVFLSEQAEGEEEAVVEIRNLMLRLQTNVAADLNRGDRDSAQRELAYLTVNPSIKQLMLVNEQGAVVLSTYYPELGQQAENISQDFRMPGQDIQLGFLAHRDNHIIQAYYPLQIQADEDGLRGHQKNWLYLEFDETHQREKLLQEIRLEVSILALGVLLATSLVWWTLRTLVVRPLVAHSHAAERMGQGDLRTRIPKSWLTELSQLGSSMGQMAQNLRLSRHQLEDRNQLISSFKEINEGLFTSADPETYIHEVSQLLRHLAGMKQARVVLVHPEENPGWSQDLAAESVPESDLELVKQTMAQEAPQFLNQACCAYPIRRRGDVWAVLLVRPDITDELLIELQHLLHELATSITYALEKFDHEKDAISASQVMRQANTVFENAGEGIFVTDSDVKIIRVNKAFTRITGYEEEEVLGADPAILTSDRHDKNYFEAMWQRLKDSGLWKGEIWNKRRDGSPLPVLLTISCVKDEQGRINNYVGTFSDITSLKQTQEKLKHMAQHDHLTGLPNRTMLLANLEQSMSQVSRHDRQMAVLFLDLDGFKAINDNMGHGVGDELLQQVAIRLRSTLRGEDFLARQGGDEFIICLPEIQDLEKLKFTAEKILSFLRSPFELGGGQSVSISGSIGASVYPGDGDDAATLIKNADIAMYRAKENGKNQFLAYNPEMSIEAGHVFAVESALKTALYLNEFELYYQPQYRLDQTRIQTPSSAEALIRWNKPGEGLIPPGEFIPLAERSSLIIDMGNWVLATACHQANDWWRHGLDHISVNISTRQLEDDRLFDRIMKILKTEGMEPEQLCLEVTETGIMQDKAVAMDCLNRLNLAGVRIAVDDFGTGHSSLGYLKSLPVKELKVDRSFVMDLPGDANDVAITNAIIAMGQSLGLEILAEGVETEQQLEFLRDAGCNFAQGFFFSRPLPADEFETLVSQTDQTATRQSSQIS